MSLKSLTDSLGEHGAMLNFAMYLVSGLTGGCYVAAYVYIRGRLVTPYLILAYLIIGAITALATGVTLKILTGVYLGWEQTWIVGTVIGAINVLAIAGINFRASIKLPHTDARAELTLKTGEKRHDP